MLKLNNNTKIVVVCFATLLLVACAATRLRPGAEKVLITHDKPEKNCKFVGSVTGNQGNFFTGGYTSNQNLQQGAFNDLKNQAVTLGANYVQLLMTNAAGTGGGGRYGGGYAQTSVSLTGNAYHCP